MARLDRLDDEPKRALQTAAVIGREFTVRLLERTAELSGPGRGVPPRAEGGRADLRAGALPRAGVHVQARPDPRRGVQQPAAGAAQGAAPPRRRRRSRSCTPTGWPSSTRRWPTTTSVPRSGTRRWTTCRRAARKRCARSPPQQAVAFYDRALAVHREVGPDRSTPERSDRAARRPRPGALPDRRSRRERRQLPGDAARPPRPWADRRTGGRGLHQLSIVSLFGPTGSRRRWSTPSAPGSWRSAPATRPSLAGSLYTTASVRRVHRRPGEREAGVEEALQVATQAAIPVLQAAVLRAARHARSLAGRSRTGARALTTTRSRWRHEHQVPDGAGDVHSGSRRLAHCGLGEYDRGPAYSARGARADGAARRRAVALPRPEHAGLGLPGSLQLGPGDSVQRPGRRRGARSWAIPRSSATPS